MINFVCTFNPSNYVAIRVSWKHISILGKGKASDIFRLFSALENAISLDQGAAQLVSPKGDVRFAAGHNHSWMHRVPLRRHHSVVWTLKHTINLYFTRETIILIKIFTLVSEIFCPRSIFCQSQTEILWSGASSTAHSNEPPSCQKAAVRKTTRRILSQIYGFGETEAANGALEVADSNHVQRLQTNGVPHAHMRLKVEYLNQQCVCLVSENTQSD